MIDEALAAVTVPSFLKTGLRVAIFSGLAFFGPSSSATITGSPFFCGTGTGTISALNRPSFWERMARLVDSSANSSWAARLILNCSAQASAHMPMCWLL